MEQSEVGGRKNEEERRRGGRGSNKIARTYTGRTNSLEWVIKTIGVTFGGI